MIPLMAVSVAVAQPWEDYQPLSAQNPIPAEFRKLSSEKYRESQVRLDRQRDGRQRTRAKDNFLLESSFLMDQVLTSGRVLFNDPVSLYLGRVLDEVLRDDPALRDSLRIYALRSSVVNAFTTDDGIILVSLGLLAQLEDEAQLAFILCHELVHFREHHVMSSYVESDDMRQGRGAYGRMGFDEQMLMRSSYSKDLEKHADREGLARFQRTGYSASRIHNVFEVMRYAHLPFDDLPFDPGFFFGGRVAIDPSYFLDRVRPPEALDQEQPAHATHPGPAERQLAVRKLLSRDDAPQGSGRDFIVSEEEFVRLREMARFETCRLYLLAGRPVMAIYTAYLLLQRHPGNAYLEEQVARGLYMLSKFKNAGQFGRVHPGYSAAEGESQQLYHLLYRMKAEELCAMAVSYIWHAHIRHPQRTDLRIMAHDLLEDLMGQFYVPGMFAQGVPGGVGEDTTATDSPGMGKYDRLRMKQAPSAQMLRHALTGLFGHKEFAEMFDRLERDRWLSPAPAAAVPARKARGEMRRQRGSGFAIGAGRVVFVSPSYAKLDLRKNRQHSFLDAESARLGLIGRIRHSAKLLRMEAEVLEAPLLAEGDAGVFNSISFLNEWADQRMAQLDAGMAALDRDRLDSLIHRHGTEHFAWMGVINYREPKPSMYFYLLYALLPPAIPFAVYYLVRPNYDTYFYCLGFNLRTGDPEMIAFSNFRLKDARDIVSSNLYDALYQLRRSPDKR